MIVQISYTPHDFKVYEKSSEIKLTLSGLEKDQLEKVSNICSYLKIKPDVFNNDSEVRNYLSLTPDQFEKLKNELNDNGLFNINDKIKTASDHYKNYDSLPIKIREFNYSAPLVMGILNVTPDSFSDGGKYFNRSTAVEHAIEIFERGADIVDIGGESSRPGSDPVSPDEELNRVIPVIEEILLRKPDALLSIDTTKSRVAGEACKRGVKIINDISGLTFDPEISFVAAEYSASLIIMHIKGIPKTMQVNPVYNNLIFEIYEFLYRQSETAKNNGVKNIIIDPGIGFGKTFKNNFEILKRISDFRSLGYPVLIGLSRKSFLGKPLNLDLHERDTVTVVAETEALRNGAKIIRSHNTVNTVQAKNILNLIYN